MTSVLRVRQGGWDAHWGSLLDLAAELCERILDFVARDVSPRRRTHARALAIVCVRLTAQQTRRTVLLDSAGSARQYKYAYPSAPWYNPKSRSVSLYLFQHQPLRDVDARCTT
jgi:hypothetical protein